MSGVHNFPSSYVRLGIYYDPTQDSTLVPP